MAPKGTKRAPQQKVDSASQAKKAKTCPTLAALGAVVENASLPDNCRDMLLAAIPASFSCHASERHAIQHLVVEMVGEVVTGAQERLQQEVEGARAKIAELEGSEGELQGQVDEAVRHHESALQELEECNAALGQAVAAKDDAGNELQSAQEAARTTEATAASRRKDLEMLTTAVEKDFPAIIKVDDDAVLPTEDAVRSTVAPLLRFLTLDQSLVIALPSACLKKPSVRGAFDKMVIDQLTETAKAKASELAANVEQDASTCKEATASVEAKRVSLEAKVEEHTAASQQVKSAGQMVSEKEAAVTCAREAAAAQVPCLNAAKASLEEKETELEKFLEHTVESFKSQRDNEKAVEAVDPVHSEATVPEPVDGAISEQPKQADVAECLAKVMDIVVEDCNTSVIGGA